MHKINIKEMPPAYFDIVKDRLKQLDIDIAELRAKREVYMEIFVDLSERKLELEKIVRDDD